MDVCESLVLDVPALQSDPRDQRGRRVPCPLTLLNGQRDLCHLIPHRGGVLLHVLLLAFLYLSSNFLYTLNIFLNYTGFWGFGGKVE